MAVNDNYFQILEENIIETVKEQQLKIGYRNESVRLYYPLSSLNRFLQINVHAEEMKDRLRDFCAYTKERLGELEITCQEERFCFKIPESGNAYVHEQTKESDFLTELIQVVQEQGCTIKEVYQTFLRYSDHVHVEKMENEEFDYLIYFEDDKPDGFYYCFHVEAGHVIYHRFTKADYREMY